MRILQEFDNKHVWISSFWVRRIFGVFVWPVGHTHQITVARYPGLLESSCDFSHPSSKGKARLVQAISQNYARRGRRSTQLLNQSGNCASVVAHSQTSRFCT